jgi:hypothetical protein
VHVLAGHVAGEGVGDDGRVGGSHPEAAGDVAGGEFSLLHADKCPGLFGGAARQTVSCLALCAGCGIDPVVCKDAYPVAKVEDDSDVAQQEISQALPPGLHDGHGGGGRAGMGEVAGVLVPSGGMTDRCGECLGRGEAGVGAEGASKAVDKPGHAVDTSGVCSRGRAIEDGDGVSVRGDEVRVLVGGLR